MLIPPRVIGNHVSLVGNILSSNLAKNMATKKEM